MDNQLYKGNISKQKSQKKVDAVEEMHQRMGKAFAEGKSMTTIYRNEKDQIAQLDKLIETPPDSVWKKERYRDKKRQERQKLLTAYSGAYGIQMNDRIYERKLSAKSNKEHQKYNLDEILANLDRETSGSSLNMQDFVNSLKTKKELENNDYTRADLLALQIDEFSQALKGDITADDARSMASYAGLEQSPGILSNILTDYTTEIKADGVKEKRLSGIDFMAEKHPKLLAMLAYQRLLAQMDTELSKRLEKQAMFEVDDMRYQTFLWQKLVLGDISAELQLKSTRDGILKEYFNYKSKLRGDGALIPKEDQERDERLFYNLSDSEINAINKWPEYFPRYKAWSNNPAHDEDMEAFDSNDVLVLTALKQKYPGDYLLNKHINFRIEQLNILNKIKATGPVKTQYTFENKGTAKKEDFEIKGINHVRQNSFNGCWSVVLMEMLAHKGINIDQRTIRCHHGEYDKLYDQDCALYQNSDTGLNLELHMNLINELLPNTSLHKVDYNMTQLNRGLVKTSFMQLIIKVVKEEKSPLAIRYNGHFRLVAGLSGDIVRVYDPQHDLMQNVKIDSIFDTIQASKKDKFLDCYYLGDIAITDNKPDFKQELDCGRSLVYDEKGQLQNIEEANKVNAEKRKAEGDGLLVNTASINDYKGYVVKTETKDQPIEMIYVPTKLKL